MFEELRIYLRSVSMFLFFVISLFAGDLVRWFFAGRKLKEAGQKARNLVESAAKEAEGRKKEIELQGKDLMIKLRQDFEAESKQRREEILTCEKRVQQKEENLDKRVDLLERKEKDINVRLAKLQEDEKSAL
ncbi:MAG: DUF3552 domain-containing protein, partial [Candidatus Omnitrophica bacterium]|nr:DUF3552 domain-containing protein [Candidatus Omnitrophota bacterium]